MQTRTPTTVAPTQYKIPPTASLVAFYISAGGIIGATLLILLLVFYFKIDEGEQHTEQQTASKRDSEYRNVPVVELAQQASV